AIFLTNLSAFGSQGRFHISILLSAVAWILLIAMIIPRQKKTLAALESGSKAVDFAKEKKQLSMFGGIFNLLWIITALLMFLSSLAPLSPFLLAACCCMDFFIPITALYRRALRALRARGIRQ